MQGHTVLFHHGGTVQRSRMLIRLCTLLPVFWLDTTHLWQEHYIYFGNTTLNHIGLSQRSTVKQRDRCDPPCPIMLILILSQTACDLLFLSSYYLRFNMWVFMTIHICVLHNGAFRLLKLSNHLKSIKSLSGHYQAKKKSSAHECTTRNDSLYFNSIKSQQLIKLNAKLCTRGIHLDALGM